MARKSDTVWSMGKKAGYGLHDSTGYWVARLASAMREEFERGLAEHGGSAPQWGVLISLYGGDARTPAELARYIGVDGAAVTRLVDRLVEKGWVKRTRSEKDRRSVKLTLTPAGRKVTAKLIPVSQKTNELFLSKLTPEEAQTFREILVKLLRRAGRKSKFGARDVTES